MVGEGHYLLFNDINTSRRMKYTPGQGVSVVKQPTNEANGLTRDLQGRLLSAEHATRRVTREDADGSITVVANNFQGKRLLRPNDVVVKSDGAIYFTDPGGPLAPDQFDVTASGVYRVSPDLGSISLIADDNHRAERHRLLAGREHSLRQRFATPPRAGLRSSAERHAGEADEPRCSPIWAAPSPACPTA